MKTSNLLSIMRWVSLGILWLCCSIQGMAQTTTLTLSHAGGETYLLIINSTWETPQPAQVQLSLEIGTQAVAQSPTFSLNVSPGAQTVSIEQIPVLKGWLQRQLDQIQQKSIGRANICAYVSIGEERSLPACTSVSIEAMPSIAIRQMYPFDESVLETTMPTFAWMPLALDDNGQVLYRLKVAPLRSHQSPEVAIQQNLAYLNQSSLTDPIWIYPLEAPALQAGHTYAWQVEAYQGVRVLARSEVWTFSLPAPTSEKEQRSPIY
ncbi:MAG: hypothetical protein AAFR59_17375, partial [Bacteroidota bacterium]